MDRQKIAKGLGWFSLALGAAEVLMPRKLGRSLGLKKDRSLLTRGFGLREIGAGIGLLSMRNRAPWLWARVAGDALDLGALGAAARTSRRRKMVAAAIASVAAVTAVDAVCAWQMSRHA